MADYHSKTQPIKLAGSNNNRPCILSGCIFLLAAVAAIALLGFFYLVTPPRLNILVIGIDRAPDGTYFGRSDTIILTTIQPLKPYFGILSIPRDLWVQIPGIGENRINTAHYFAELENPGSGPFRTIETIKQNFGVKVDYFIRIRFDGFEQVVDAMDGVEIELDQPMSGYQPGVHKLDGPAALAFVRDRSGADDFYRMAHGQLFVKAIVKQLLKPDQWKYIPAVWRTINDTIDTNLPFWQWPRLIFTLIRVSPTGIDNYVITREMVKPFTTDGGAQVLAPNWDLINPQVIEIFGR